MRTVPFFICTFFLYDIGAQSNYQRSIGGLDKDCGDAVIQTRDGGYAIAGQTSSFGAGYDDFIIIKFSPSGAIDWQKTYGGAGKETGNGFSFAETADGSIVATGMSTSFDGERSSLYVFKIDVDGNILWDNQYSTGQVNGPAQGRGILVSRDDHYLILGSDDARILGGSDALALKVDHEGNLLWKRIVGGASRDQFHDAIELPGGNVLISGSSSSFGPGSTSGYLVKLDPHGNLLWANTYGASDDDEFIGCDTTHDHAMIITGSSRSSVNGSNEILLCKIDSTGAVHWAFTYGTPFQEVAPSVVTLPQQEGYLIAGRTTTALSTQTDFLVLKVDINGSLLWARSFGTLGVESVELFATSALAITDDEGFILTGWSDSLTLDHEDILIVRSDAEGRACAILSL